MGKSDAFRTMAWIVILMVIFSFMLNVSKIVPQEKAPLKIEYGELTKQIESGNIKTAKLGNNADNGYIEGEFQKPIDGNSKFIVQTFHIYMSDARELEKTIKAKNLDAKVELIQEKPSSFFLLLISYLPTLLMIGFFIYMLRSIGQKSGLGGINQFIKARTTLASGASKKTFADVAGIDEAKEELKEIVEFLKTPQKFQKLGGRIPKGVLLIGPPGSGKTLLARAVAGEANVPFFSISGSDFVEMFVGVGAGRVRNLFEQGKKNAPCIVFIDEIDAVGRHRGTGVGGGHDEREQTLNALLVEMDGFETNSSVIIIAATNRPDVLDPALLRPGRFDRRVVVNSPDVKGRFEILKVHARQIPLDEKADLSVIARGTPGFTGADLANLLNEAALEAARYDRKTVIAKDLEFAKDKVLMGTERRSMIISDKEKKTIAYHEAGHAIVATLVPEADPIHKVTIIPRGMSLGSTSQLPEEDKHNHSKEYLKSQLAILMGGRAAEEIFLIQLTTGASNDLERATELAERMIREWGMSESLEPRTFRNNTLHPFLGKKLSDGAKDYSEDTANKIDLEIKKLVVDAYEKAKNILRSRRKETKLLAEALLDKETVDGEEVFLIVKGSA